MSPTSLSPNPLVCFSRPNLVGKPLSFLGGGRCVILASFFPRFCSSHARSPDVFANNGGPKAKCENPPAFGPGRAEMKTSQDCRCSRFFDDARSFSGVNQPDAGIAKAPEHTVRSSGTDGMAMPPETLAESSPTRLPLLSLPLVKPGRQSTLRPGVPDRAQNAPHTLTPLAYGEAYSSSHRAKTGGTHLAHLWAPGARPRHQRAGAPPRYQTKARRR